MIILKNYRNSFQILFSATAPHFIKRQRFTRRRQIRPVSIIDFRIQSL
jgi:hypothetical protein